jgi:UDP-2,3-diacylglucosamine pyrophosphatase LpxH
MLVFISDLHFVDGTAGEHNLSSRAFEYFFDDLAAIANKPSNKIKEIKLVFLGDTFDLLRTEKWFDYPVDERPWGTKEQAIEDHAQTLFNAILNHAENSQSFQIIRQGVSNLRGKCGLESAPTVIYVPGNHDRLCNRYVSLRKKVCDTLGISASAHNPADPFSHNFQDLAYGVFARHGHEYDKFSYEGGNSYTLQDYQKVPIGDPITTELVARLPYEMARRIAPIQWLTPEQKKDIIRNFQEIEDVRPLTATVEWLLYKVRPVRKIREIVDDAVQAVVDYFDKLDFVKNWYKRHDKWTEWLEEVAKIRALLFLLRKFGVYRTGQLWKLALKAGEYFSKDDLLEAAPREYEHLDSRICYVVYGHTHDPLVVALRSFPVDPYPLEQVYLNTGTWRGRYFQATQDNSFIGWKNMTYVIFYKKGERETRFPVFETWTGSLKLFNPDRSLSFMGEDAG